MSARRWWAVTCAMALLAAAPAAAQPQPDLTLEYGRLDGHPLHLDLYFPASGTPPYPLVVYIHGGGWSGGGRWPVPAVCLSLRDAGFAIASVSYRLTSQTGMWGTHGVSHPAQVHDVKGAIRFLRARAGTYGLDPTRFGAFGHSAGGHLAALVATSAGVPELEGTVGGNLGQSSAVIAAADYYGPTNILRLMDDVTFPPGWIENHDAYDSNASSFIGYNQPGQGIGDIKENIDNPDPPYPELLALLEQANPVTHVDPSDPPMYIAHGDMDRRIALHQSTRLADALAAAGVPHEYIIVAGADHSAAAVGAVADAGLIAFFQSTLADCAPAVVEPPADTTAGQTQTVTLTVQAAGSSLGYQWRKDGAPLTDDGRLSGAQTPTLTIVNLVPSDAGAYDVVISNACGSIVAGPADLTVTPCAADWDGNGALDVADFTGFRAGFLAGDTRADFNGDGALGVTDFTAFRNAFLAGCP